MRAATPDSVGQVRLASGLSVLAGIWLIIAPFILRYVAPQAYWNDIIVGVVVAVLAAIRFAGAYSAAWLSWITVALGIWLIIATFILRDVTAQAHWNDVILGIMVTILGIWSALESHPRAHYPQA